MAEKVCVNLFLDKKIRQWLQFHARELGITSSALVEQAVTLMAALAGDDLAVSQIDKANKILRTSTPPAPAQQRATRKRK